MIFIKIYILHNVNTSIWIRKIKNPYFLMLHKHFLFREYVFNETMISIIIDFIVFTINPLYNEKDKNKYFYCYLLY